MAPQRVRIGVSACLLGERVRWDGGHKRDALLAAAEARFIEWTPLCPEVELGMGVPREPIALRGSVERLRLVGLRSGRDYTRAMQRFARRRANALCAAGLAGVVLKRGSPSCGLARVPIRRAPAAPAAFAPVARLRALFPAPEGRGIFAAALLAAAPDLPAIESEALHNPSLRAHWAERVFARWRLQRLCPAQLADFHARHKLQLEAHAPGAFAKLAQLAKAPPAASRGGSEAYRAAFMAVLARPVSRRRGAAVLRRALRPLRGALPRGAWAEWERLCGGYRRGILPLSEPAAWLAQNAQRLGLPALAEQSLLRPHPGELWLRGAA